MYKHSNLSNSSYGRTASLTNYSLEHIPTWKQKWCLKYDDEPPQKRFVEKIKWFVGFTSYVFNTFVCLPCWCEGILVSYICLPLLSAFWNGKTIQDVFVIIEMANILVKPPRNCFAIICFILDVTMAVFYRVSPAPGWRSTLPLQESRNICESANI